MTPDDLTDIIAGLRRELVAERARNEVLRVERDTARGRVHAMEAELAQLREVARA